jgi:hypothetical protein
MASTIYDCPVEILEHIIKYCNYKECLHLNNVDSLFHTLTKSKIKELKGKLNKFVFERDSGIFYYIIVGDYHTFELLLETGLMSVDTLVNNKKNMFVIPNEVGEYSLIDLCIRPTSLGEYSLIDLCIRYKNLDMIKSLVKHGLDVNKKNKKGLTPLMNAVRDDLWGLRLRGECERRVDIFEVIRYLLETGADPNIENNMGYIAMDMINSRFDGFWTHVIVDWLRDFDSREGSVTYDVFC